MRKDIPYEALKHNEQAYEIMQLRDQLDSSFSDIAKKFGITLTRVTKIYRMQKNRQIQLYINHISIALGHDSNSQIVKIFKAADECYRDRTYVCGYLEKKYNDILTEYRNGEAGMPQRFLKKIPPLKSKLLPKTVARIIEMRESENASFVEIGKKFHITRQKAKYTYDWYYHTKTLELIATLQNKTESRQEKKEIWDYCFRNDHTAKKRYEMMTEKYCRSE